MDIATAVISLFERGGIPAVIAAFTFILWKFYETYVKKTNIDYVNNADINKALYERLDAAEQKVVEWRNKSFEWQEKYYKERANKRQVDTDGK